LDCVHQNMSKGGEYRTAEQVRKLALKATPQASLTAVP